MKSEKNSLYLRACSLAYDEGAGSLPWLSCIGEQQLADRMVRIAQRYGVPLVEDPELARVLSKIPVDADIPKELFEVIALVLAEVLKRESFLKKNITV